MLAPQMTDARSTSRTACARSNRHCGRLEWPVNHSKQTIGTLSNRHQIQNTAAGKPSVSIPVSNRQLPETEDLLSHSKQTATYRSNRQLFAALICSTPPSANSKTPVKLLPFSFSLFYFARPIFRSPFSGLSARIMAIPSMTSEARNGFPVARTRTMEPNTGRPAHREEDLPWD